MKLARNIPLLFILAALLLSACGAPLAGDSAATPTAQTPAPTRGTTPPVSPVPPLVPTEPTGIPLEDWPEAARAARAALAEKLDIAIDGITIVSANAVDWSDSCLGLGGPAEACMQVITPGYSVRLRADGVEYEAHTTENGSVVRFVEGVIKSDRIETVALAVLAKSLGIAPGDIRVVRRSATDWPNSCLGAPVEGQVCAEVITPGYAIVLEAQGAQYEVRTDLTGDIAVLAPASQ